MLGGTRGSGLKAGKLYRSSSLNGLRADGVAGLSELGVHAVVDVRSEYEIGVHGRDRVPAGVHVLHRPFATGSSGRAVHAIPPLETDEQRWGYMLDTYRSFPEMDGAAVAVRTVVDLILDSPACPVLVHCAAGKDRTGWVIAVVLLAAGVPIDAVYADYLESNSAVDTLRRLQLRQAGNADLSDLLLGVRAEYLDAALARVDRDFGGFAAYADSIGLPGVRRARLRHVLIR
jgi:protein-tyrosine phosphatase